MVTKTPLSVGIIGSGAAGLSAAWLLGKRQQVTLLEQDSRLGGHAHTAWVDEARQVEVYAEKASPNDTLSKPKVASYYCEQAESGLPYLDAASHIVPSQELKNSMSPLLAIDTGFIVFNRQTYPNMVPWLAELGVSCEPTDMSFSVSRENGRFEYAGGVRGGLLAQPRNLLRPRFWLMLKDLVRFYRQSSKAYHLKETMTLGEFLDEGGYNSAFINDHLLPFGAAIWSTSRARMLDYPVASFVRFCDNHGLLKLSNRPQWYTISGGSAKYVNAVRAAIGEESIACNFKASQVQRKTEKVVVHSCDGRELEFDHVVFACHADQALALIDQPDERERQLLGAFEYASNKAVLHTDIRYLPKRARAWASWNYVEQTDSDTSSAPGINYWMNRLQNLKTDTHYIVSLNPLEMPPEQRVLRETQYTHPIFNSATYQAQSKLWQLQGSQRSWFCGSYFGAGFHEDAIQSGLSVAEQLGGIQRPWRVENESSRIFLQPAGSTVSSGKTRESSEA